MFEGGTVHSGCQSGDVPQISVGITSDGAIATSRVLGSMASRRSRTNILSRLLTDTLATMATRSWTSAKAWRFSSSVPWASPWGCPPQDPTIGREVGTTPIVPQQPEMIPDPNVWHGCYQTEHTWRRSIVPCVMQSTESAQRCNIRQLDLSTGMISSKVGFTPAITMNILLRSRVWSVQLGPRRSVRDGLTRLPLPKTWTFM
mmetsp:Transcript_11190/g.24258  ORF Transcript_11190/g.24258 Transcript_11190/m.24258 type:complete len:202 (-) Transcript_11190:449-1054(-)